MLRISIIINFVLFVEYNIISLRLLSGKQSEMLVGRYYSWEDKHFLSFILDKVFDLIK